MSQDINEFEENHDHEESQNQATKSTGLQLQKVSGAFSGLMKNRLPEQNRQQENPENQNKGEADASPYRVPGTVARTTEEKQAEKQAKKNREDRTESSVDSVDMDTHQPGEPKQQDTRTRRQQQKESSVDNVDKHLYQQSHPSTGTHGQNTIAAHTQESSSVNNVDINNKGPNGLGGMTREQGLREEKSGPIRGLLLLPSEPTLLATPQQIDKATVAKSGPSGPSLQSIQAVQRALDQRTAGRRQLKARANENGVDPGSGSQASRVSVHPQARANTTVTQGTLDEYMQRGRRLLVRYRREMAVDSDTDEINPVEFVSWALSRKPTLSSSTWRFYRQCMLHYLDGYPSYEAETAIKMLHDSPVDQSRPQPAPVARGQKPSRKTSALKEKRFPVEDYERVQFYLRTFNRSRLGPVLADWLRVGILTGLRPGEWRATDLEIRDDTATPYGRRVYLYVLNAKATNGRATGAVRTLDLSAFSNDDLAVVQRMVERAREWLEGGKYTEIQGQCSGLLYTAIEKIWPTRRYHYSLYSSRHQAIANWKAIPLQPSEIAAIVGHGITSTAAEHYGKRRSSWVAAKIPQPPRAVAEEMAIVRDQIRIFQRRMELEVQAGLRKSGDMPEFPVG